MKLFPPNQVWWKSPAAIGLLAVVVAGSAGVMFEDKLIPQPKLDPRTHVPMPGGGSFCDPLPVPAGPPTHAVPTGR